MIPTLGLVLLTIATLFLAGYGPTLLLLSRKDNLPRVVAMPLVGLASYLFGAHFLAGLHLDGRSISLINPMLFVGLILVVPRSRRLDRREVMDSLGVFAICSAGLLLAIWPLLREGYANYLAFANPDAAYNLNAYEFLQRQPYSSLGRFLGLVHLPSVFGAGYIVMLLTRVTGIEVLKLHTDVVSAGIFFVAPAAVFLFSVVGLKAARRTGLIAAAVSSVSSLVYYTLYLQSLGAITFVALLPAVVTACSEALETGKNRLMLLTALLFTGLSFGYYAAFPVMGLLLAVAAAVAVVQRLAGFKEMLRLGLIFGAVFLVSYPALIWSIFRITLYEAGSSLHVASAAGSEGPMAFAFALTEQYLPFFWGMSIPPLAASSLFEEPAWGFLLALGLSVLFSVVVLWGLFRPRRPVPLHIRAQMCILIAIIGYFSAHDNSYGVFKLAAWVNPVFLPFLVCAIAPDAALSGKVQWLNRLRYCVLIALIGLNANWCVRLAHASLRDTTTPGKILAGFTGVDFESLRSIAKVIPKDSRILLATPDPVVQRWAMPNLRLSKFSVVPFLNLSTDQRDGLEEGYAAGAESARYILTWAGPDGDVVSWPPQHPVWRNARFQLIPLASAHNLLIAGRFWYRTEIAPQSTLPWQHRFRWLRSHGELLLLNASGEDLRLRLTVVAGYGQPAPERTISFALNGEKFDEIRTAGLANVITKPFRATGFMNWLTISLPDTASPIRRRWALFRPWVPKDPRRLNVAISKIQLLTNREYAELSLPCRLDLSHPDDWNANSLNGIFADRWIAGEAHVSLQPCEESDTVMVRGFMPGIAGLGPVFPVTISVNGAQQVVKLKKAGPFTIEVPLHGTAQNGGRYDVAVGSPRTFVPAERGLGPDGRRLSIMLDSVELGHHAPARAAP